MKLSWFKIREYLFYILIFILPWQTRWIIRDIPINGGVWEYGRISLYSWDILLILLLLLSWQGVFGILKQWLTEVQEIKNQKSKIKILFNPFTIYLLFSLYIFISIIWSSDKTLAVVWSMRLLEGGILWFLIKTIKPKLNLLFLSLAATGTIQALWGTWQFLTQSTFASKWLGVAVHPLTQAGTSVVLTSADRWLRAYAGQVHPNVLGGLLVITCLVTMWVYLENIKFKNQNAKWFLALYILQLIGLFFTFSRGAWLALFVTLIIWSLAVSGKNKRSLIFSRHLVDYENIQPRKNILIITFLVFVVMGFLYWQPTVGRFTGGSKLEQQSIDERVDNVGESRSLLKEFWWRGVGMGNYTVALINFEPSYAPYRYQPVHNIFFLVLTELGVIGLLIFLWLLWQKLQPPIIRNSLFIIPTIITSFFDHYWWTIPSMFILLWLIIFLKEIDKANLDTHPLDNH
jgi:hypothetical protein